MVTAHKVLVNRTAHYYTIGNPGPHVRYFWIACHGYGQMAGKFIRRFETLNEADSFVLAPEGLSRFYWKRLPDQVGSSWMTRENRLDEIADYTRYIRSLYDTYKNQLPAEAKIILFGFSQGCATQMRWVMGEFPEFHHLVLWAGMVPEDLAYLPQQDYFGSIKKWFVYGDKDQFLTRERLDWHRGFLKDQNLDFVEIVFDGTHRIEPAAFNSLVGKIRRED